MEKKVSFPKERMKIVLLESIHPVALDVFKEAGYQAKSLNAAWSEDELKRELSSVHVLGIRSKTEVRGVVLENAKSLLAMGCFCIGTNQVDLIPAAKVGIPVFNAPFSNTRSVAELAIAEIIMLARKAAHKSLLLHQGKWEKTASRCFEVRGKTVGIIGYGHIGQQVGVLAESMGMKVVFFDVSQKLPLGNTRQVSNLTELLATADFVTLHVPETPQTKDMISAKELAACKQGSYLINLSRGSVVDIGALKEALVSGKLEGAAIDVFPVEPQANVADFTVELAGIPNVILTPHIGGSTDEAQYNIGIEVANSLIRFIETGTTAGAVNFPQVDLPVVKDSHRILNIHRNVPGVLSNINQIIASVGANIKAQYLRTTDEVGYLIIDIDREISQQVKEQIDALESNIKTRLLF
jgi:D-3-phosphoglycerate dehydrogenase / 2-oxoglutarate reductase